MRMCWSLPCNSCKENVCVAFIVHVTKEGRRGLAHCRLSVKGARSRPDLLFPTPSPGRDYSHTPEPSTESERVHSICFQKLLALYLPRPPWTHLFR